MLACLTRSARAAAALAALAAAALAGAVAASPAAAASWVDHQTDRDWCYDATSIDRNGNGNPEHYWFDLDNDCRWDTHLWNSRAWDGFHESATYDMNENGRPEYRLLDVDQREGFEWLYVDRWQDGRWDFRRVIPGSSIDYGRRITTNIVNNRLLHEFTMRTGGSLLFPSIPTPY